MLSIVYVVLHHGIMGTIAPMLVFDSARCADSPWKWAAIHGAYIVAAVLFIAALAGLSRHETAKRGNLAGMVGMGIALVATLVIAARQADRLTRLVDNLIDVSEITLGALLQDSVAVKPTPK